MSAAIHILTLGKTGISKVVRSWISPHEGRIWKAAQGVDEIEFDYVEKSYGDVDSDSMTESVEQAHALILNFGTDPAKRATRNALQKYNAYREKIVVLYTERSDKESKEIQEYGIPWKRVIAVPLDVIRGDASAAEARNAEEKLIRALCDLVVPRAERNTSPPTNGDGKPLLYLRILCSALTPLILAIGALITAASAFFG